MLLKYLEGVFMKIVYESNAGHTEQYANMLAKKLNIECVSTKQYKKDSDSIIYMGWVFGNNIVGYNKLADINKICTIAVGMSYESKTNSDSIISTNNIKEKFFYLQGGLDYNKLKGIKKMMLKMVAKSTIKANKEEDKEIIEVFKNGGNFIKEDNLKDIVKYINNLK